MNNKTLIKHLEKANAGSEVMFITDNAIYEVLTVAYIQGYKEGNTEFHVWLNKLDEIIPVDYDNTLESGD